MDNSSLVNEEQNVTVFCGEPYSTFSTMMDINLLVFSCPITIAVILMLLSRMYKARSLSPAEVFLLQINFTNLCLFFYHLLHFLTERKVMECPSFLYVLLYIPSLTASPVFLLAICTVFYLAIIHPVTYMTAKTWHHWEWLVVTFGWFYALAMDVAIIVYKINYQKSGIMGLFLLTVLPIMINFNTLRALRSSGPRNDGHMFRKAFRFILSIQLVLLMYFVSEVYAYFFPFFVFQKDWKRFICARDLVFRVVPEFCEFIMPVI